MAKKLIGQVTPEERNEIQTLYERRHGQNKLPKILTTDNAEMKTISKEGDNETRRSFFRKCSSAILTVIAIPLALSGCDNEDPLIDVNPGCTDCTNACKGACSNTCRETCKNGCGGTCKDGCKTACQMKCAYGCTNSCQGSCTGDCSNTCFGDCSNTSR